MSGPAALAVMAGLLLLAGLLYWQLKLAEGAYLGRRVVVWLYDRYASRYDQIKDFHQGDEAYFLGAPLARALLSVPTPLVLDVATGTGRLPLALLRQPTFRGRVVGLDLSRRMLALAARKTERWWERSTFIWQGAQNLPFPDDSFDAVACLEALEFLPNPSAALADMVRVLRPGGLLLATNRVGPVARFMPGRTFDRDDFSAWLAAHSLTEVRVTVWQVDYDLAWARKPGRSTQAAPAILPALLRCPRCGGEPLARRQGAFHCPDCRAAYPVAADGVIEMAG